MKILLTTHVFFPESTHGTETLVRDVALALKQCGHSVIVVTGQIDNDEVGEQDCFDEYLVNSIRVIRFRRSRTLDNLNPVRDDYDNVAFETGFRRLLLEFKPDVVHFHHFGRLSIKAVDAARENGIPTFLTVTDYWPICLTQALLLPNGKICSGPTNESANCLKHIAIVSQPKWLAESINHIPTEAIGVAMRVLKRNGKTYTGRIGAGQSLAKRPGVIADRLLQLNRIFVPTRHAQTTLENNGVVGGKFRVLPFGIKEQGYVKRVRVRRNSGLVLGFIGQFLFHKGLHVLIDAIRLLPPSRSVQLKIYGKSPAGETPYLQELRDAARRDVRVKFCGTFDNGDISAVLDGLDAMVIPSLWHENMPLVSLSAQAAGCPLIASDVGGLSDVIRHGMSGLLFTPGSATELRDRIEELLSDRDLLQRLSDAAVNPLSMNQYVNELEREYRQAIEETN